jgi:hypothetical protein
MTLFEKTVRRDSNTDKYESLQEAYMKVLNEASPQHMSNKLEKIISKNLYNIKGFGYSEKEGLHAYSDDKEVMKKIAKDIEKISKAKTKMEKIGNTWVVLQNDKDISAGLKVNIKHPIFKESINEAKKEYSDDDWVLVADRKAIKFYKNPKNDKAPKKAYDDMNDSSKNYEVIRISKAKKMGIKGV